MSVLVFCDGTEQRGDYAGIRVLRPTRVSRGQFYELALAVFEYDGRRLSGDLEYRERYWEVPRKHCDECSNPGMHYYPR